MVSLPGLDEVVTPALVVDRGRLLANVQAMAERARSLGVSLRPHAKTHKSSAIAAHACAAANLHSQMLVVGDETVVDVWPITTREWRLLEAERRPAWSMR